MSHIRSASTRAHKKAAPKRLTFAVLTVSTRGAEARRGRGGRGAGRPFDESGDLIVERLAAAGHRLVGRALAPDGVRPVRAAAARLLKGNPDLLVTTGGTGLASKDVTVEALAPKFDKEIPGFGYLFFLLSTEEVGAAAMLSRATAGIVGKTLVVLLPGSPAACRLAVEKILIPEAAHVVKHARE